MTLWQRRATHFFEYAFIITFWALCIVPLFKPGLSIDTLADGFLGRQFLAQSFNGLRFLVGDRVFPTVLIGKEGQMFASGTFELSGYQHTYPFTQAELQAYQLRLDEIDSRLRQKGITFLIVIAPDKSTIYPQYVPDSITVVPGASRLGQFIQHMAKHSRIQIVDLRSDLIQASQKGPVYYKTDIHWTYMGEYIAYSKVLAALSPRFPELQPHHTSDYKLLSLGENTLALANVAGLPFIKEKRWRLVPKFTYSGYTAEFPISPELWRTLTVFQNQDSSLPSLLVFHDSFFLQVNPLFTPHFSRVISVATKDPRYMNLNLVDVMKPDIVILEFSESHMTFEEDTIPALK